MFLFLSLPLIFSFLAVYHGQDNSWDLRNYHYYSAYALDTGRFDQDIHLSQVQTYLNPAIDLVFYKLIGLFKPRTATFMLGYIQGLNASLLLLISLLIIRPLLAPGTRLIGAVAVTLAGCYAPTIFSLAGTASNDITASLFVLTAILLVIHLKSLPEASTTFQRIMLGIAGIVMGMGVGLKLTLLIYAIALTAALMFADSTWKSRIEGAIIASTGLLVGFMISRGPWMWYLWQNFESPLFPFYNQIFQSPYYLLQNFEDARFLPKSLLHHLMFPFIRGFENSYTAIQMNHQDLRYGVVYALLAATLAVQLWQRGNRSAREGYELRWHDHERFLIVFCIVAYTVWQLKFALWRYVNPLEQLAPLVVIILVVRLVTAEKLRLAIISLLLVIIALSVRTKSHNRIPFRDEYFRIEVPQIENPERAAIIVPGGRPWAYLAPAFPPEIRFIRISSNMITPGDSTRLVDRIRSAVANQEGPMYLLSRRQYLAAHLRELQTYGLTYSTNQAMSINSEHEPPGLFLLSLKRF